MALLGSGKICTNMWTLQTAFPKTIENCEMRDFWELGRAISVCLLVNLRQGLMEPRLNLTHSVVEDELEFLILLSLLPES